MKFGHGAEKVLLLDIHDGNFYLEMINSPNCVVWYKKKTLSRNFNLRFSMREKKTSLLKENNADYWDNFELDDDFV